MTKNYSSHSQKKILKLKQAKPGWFSPKVKAIGGGIATTACLITTAICYKKLQGINKILNNPLEMELLAEDEIENLKSKQKWCQVGFWGGAIASVPCGIITGMGIEQWIEESKKPAFTFFDIEFKDGAYHATIFDDDVKISEKSLDNVIKFLEKINETAETKIGPNTSKTLLKDLVDPAIEILAGTASALKKIREKKSLNECEKNSLAMALGIVRKWWPNIREDIDKFEKWDEKQINEYIDKEFKKKNLADPDDESLEEALSDANLNRNVGFLKSFLRGAPQKQSGMRPTGKYRPDKHPKNEQGLDVFENEETKAMHEWAKKKEKEQEIPSDEK
jgi:hypothetical protein